MRLKNYAWGIYFIAAAAFLLLNQLGLLGGIFPEGISNARALFALIIIPIVIESFFYLRFFGIFIPLAIALSFFAKPLGLENVSFWAMLITAIFLSVGCNLLFGRRNWHKWNEKWRKSEKLLNKFPCGEDYVTDDEVSCTVSFGANSKYVHSENLRSARFTSSFGEIKVYFDQCTLDADGAEVFVSCSFGAIQLFVPRDWHVINKVRVSLGDVREINKPGHSRDYGTTLTVNGSVTFGSVVITYI